MGQREPGGNGHEVPPVRETDGWNYVPVMQNVMALGVGEHGGKWGGQDRYNLAESPGSTARVLGSNPRCAQFPSNYVTLG